MTSILWVVQKLTSTLGQSRRILLVPYKTKYLRSASVVPTLTVNFTERASDVRKGQDFEPTALIGFRLQATGGASFAALVFAGQLHQFLFPELLNLTV